MNIQQIRTAQDNGIFPHEILTQMIQSGYEFPDAVMRIAKALRMDSEEVSHMKDAYDNYC